jgi:hypothetical protein
MNYQERIDELAGLLERAELPSDINPNAVRDRIAVLIALRKDEQPDFPCGTLVARQMGPLHMGEVIEPTTADKDRRARELSTLALPTVLVQWRSLRSWEYVKDLRRVP